MRPIRSVSLELIGGVAEKAEWQLSAHFGGMPSGTWKCQVSRLRPTVDELTKLLGPVLRRSFAVTHG
ncbi:hypothetical protein HC62_17195 [Acetobacter tropicalis]|uniref:Uncharacterized protein n=1 Tax=Acetobacter tropicalis TaxID=104102 RepID=A0A252A035_9PROT|nr:hypothetical protein HC62_17195 [Acetobacter tropicalis]